MTPYRLMRRTAGKILRAIPWTRRMLLNSCDHKVVSEQQARASHGGGWHYGSTVTRQERAYDQLLDEMRRGDARQDFRIAARAVDLVGLGSPSLLEIGCGSGYFSEIFDTLCASKTRYTGLDYSEAMIARARSRYPGKNFITGDATRLDMTDGAYDIVYNGVSLMHILDYEKAIAEAARVAAKAAIFHSVPVLSNHETIYLTKYAYGAPVAEVVFNRDALLALFSKYGLTVSQHWHSDDYSIGNVVGEQSRAETFLCIRS
jgi:ubiquinone/menaquinone biosynthesis C-methylase UbiE